MNLGVFLSWLVTICLIAFSAFYAATRGPLSADGWSYSDLVTVILTAVTVVLAALGLGIAAIAIWGYDRIERNASDAAVNEARDMIDRHLKSARFVEQVREIVEDLPKSEAFEGVRPGEQNGDGNDNGGQPFEREPPEPGGGG